MTAKRPPTAAESFSKFSLDERLRALRYYFGQPDADVHALASLTGLAAEDISNRQNGPEPLGDGFSAIRTCSLEWRRDTLTPSYLGDWPYWRDAIHGFWATGSLDRVEPRYPAALGR